MVAFLWRAANYTTPRSTGALSSVVERQNDQYVSLKQRQALLELQSSEMEKRLEKIRYSRQKARVMRHDLRYYLQIIDGYAAEGNDAAIREYVWEIQTSIDETAIAQYCFNEQVNLVVSSCVGKAEKHGGTADFSCRDGAFTVRAVL